MEVEELIARAWGAVRDAGVPEPLQELAFRRAIEHLSGESPTRQPASGKPPAAAEGRSTAKKDSGESPKVKVGSNWEIFEKFAKEASIPATELQEVYYFDDSGPHLNGPRSKYGSSTREQAQNIVLAIVTARDYALDEAETTDEAIKTECLRLKCDPKRNWSTVMNSLSTVTYGGPKGGKVARVKPSSHESLRALVSKVRGMESAE
ncbi:MULTISPECIES: hypothetical protein [Rhodococcus]|uniref:hypothetical protein n=1 Tax=Rhodococcus TaxID=1827 RepID=UPI001BE66CCD|nr:hypothetical protein [Rhodococcus erythropolis]MBT2264632.1 hypothetical protein [Rhodococcus erythropolis]